MDFGALMGMMGGAGGAEGAGAAGAASGAEGAGGAGGGGMMSMLGGLGKKEDAKDKIAEALMAKYIDSSLYNKESPKEETGKKVQENQNIVSKLFGNSNRPTPNIDTELKETPTSFPEPKDLDLFNGSHAQEQKMRESYGYSPQDLENPDLRKEYMNRRIDNGDFRGISINGYNPEENKYFSPEDLSKRPPGTYEQDVMDFQRARGIPTNSSNQHSSNKMATQASATDQLMGNERLNMLNMTNPGQEKINSMAQNIAGQNITTINSPLGLGKIHIINPKANEDNQHLAATEVRPDKGWGKVIRTGV